MKKVLAILLALTLCVGMISGCTKIEKDDPAAKGAEFEVYMGTKVTNLDPATSYTDENAVKILSLVFEGLTKLDENGKLKKALAKKIEITEDPKTGAPRLEITIRDTHWSDGSAVQANDVIYAWKRILEPDFNSTAVSMLYCVKGARAAKAGEISIHDIGLYSTKQDKFIVEFEDGTTEAEIEEFIYNTSSPALVPLRENKVVSYPDTWSKSATDLSTNGPFRVKKFSAEKGEEVVLERSKYYRLNQDVSTEAVDKYVTPFRITIRYDLPLDKEYVSSAAENDVLSLFNNKEIFYVGGLTANTAAKYGKNLAIAEEASTFCFYFNLDSKPFKNAVVRQAFSMALDRNHVASLIGLETEAATGLLNDKVYNTKKGTSFREEGGAVISAESNLEAAKQLLAENGIYGDSFSDIYIVVRQDEANDSYQSQQMGYMSKEKAIAEYAKSVWEALGFYVVVESLEGTSYDQRIATGEYDVLGLDFQMISAHALYNLAAFSNEFSGDAVPVTGYVNEEYDALITEAYAENDPAKRAEYLHQAEAILLSDDAVIVPVIFNTNAYVVSSELSKVETNYWGAQVFTKTELKDYVQYLPSVKEAAAKEQENAG